MSFAINKIEEQLSKKTIKLYYFLVAMTIFFSTKNSPYSRNSFVFYGLTIILFALLNRKLKLLTLPSLQKFFGFFILLNIIYLVQMGKFGPLFFINIIMIALFSTLVISAVGSRFFEIFENIVYKLSLISFPFFALQLLSFDLTMSIVKMLESAIFVLEPNNNPEQGSFILWGLQTGGIYRNSGFMWEPGAFAAILILAIIFNITRNKFALNKRLTVLIIALITTFSTMGYLALCIIFLYVLYNKNISYKMILTPLILMLFVYIWSLDFIYEKIKDEYSNVDQTVNSTMYGEIVGFRSLGRLGSLVVDVRDFIRYPVAGVGASDELRSQSLSSNTIVNRTNGLSGFLVQFGLVGMLFMLINLNNTFKTFTEVHSAKGKLFFTLIIMVITFSNTIILTPLLGSLMFFTFPLKRNNTEIQQIAK